MIGFSLQIKGEVIYAAVGEGVVGVIISGQNGDFTITLNGVDSRDVYHVWYDDKLDVGDSITLKYDNIDESDVSKPISIRDVNERDSSDKFYLESYYKLRQELSDEGLI